jgi:hypothetical protein
VAKLKYMGSAGKTEMKSREIAHDVDFF